MPHHFTGRQIAQVAPGDFLARDSLGGFGHGDKFGLMLVEGHDEFGEVLTTSYSAEAFRRPQTEDDVHIKTLDDPPLDGRFKSHLEPSRFVVSAD